MDPRPRTTDRHQIKVMVLNHEICGFTWLPALDSSQLASVPTLASLVLDGLGFRGGNFTQIDRRHLTNNLT